MYPFFSTSALLLTCSRPCGLKFAFDLTPWYDSRLGPPSGKLVCTKSPIHTVWTWFNLPRSRVIPVSAATRFRAGPILFFHTHTHTHTTSRCVKSTAKPQCCLDKGASVSALRQEQTGDLAMLHTQTHEHVRDQATANFRSIMKKSNKMSTCCRVPIRHRQSDGGHEKTLQCSAGLQQKVWGSSRLSRIPTSKPFLI